MALGDTYLATVRREPFLVVYWRGNDVPTAVVAQDYAARYGLDGIYIGSPSPPSGPGVLPLVMNDPSAGSGLYGSGISMQVGDAPQLRVLGDLSIEAWVVSYSATQTAVIVGKGTSTFKAKPYALSLVAGCPTLSIGNGTTKVDVTAPAAVPVGRPTHLVATSFRGALSVLVDGVVVATGTLGSQTVIDGGLSVYVGGGQQSGSSFTGLIAEAAVYNGALSLRRAARHFAIGRAVLSNPASYTTLDAPVYS